MIIFFLSACFFFIGVLPAAALGFDISLDANSELPGCGSLCNAIPEGGAIGFSDSIIQQRTLIEAIAYWTNFFLGFLGLIAMALLLYYGFLYVTARGEDEQAETAKKGILYVVLGILLLLSLYALVNTIIVAGVTSGLEPLPPA